MTDELTLMAVHAHPDDEASSTGGVFARYSDEGVHTVLVTCTNGELGDGPGHVKPGEPGHDEKEVVRVRLAELETSRAALGIEHGELLGYDDSGMAEWRWKDEPDSFCNVPARESTARLVELFEKYRPDIVITYDDTGAYNHPDHLQAHHITVAAFEETRIPAKLYFTARRRRDWDRMRELLLEHGLDLPTPLQRMDEARRKEFETRTAAAEARITTTIDIADYAARKRAALAAHASQLDESWWVKLPVDSIGEAFTHETFIRAYDSTGAPVPETDLFAGLR
jgi:LmbE family N-acetylglucosaminyl deacetylase